MRFLNRVAYALLASMFVSGGLDSLRHPESKLKAAEPVIRLLTRQVPVVPKDSETLVKINGAAQVLGGILLATGKLRRPASTLLAGSLVPTTLAGHRFWEEINESRRAQQQIHFLKNLGLLGGLIIVATSRN